MTGDREMVAVGAEVLGAVDDAPEGAVVGASPEPRARALQHSFVCSGTLVEAEIPLFS